MRSYFRPILGGLAAGAIFATLPVLAGGAQAQTKKQPKGADSRRADIFR